MNEAKKAVLQKENNMTLKERYDENAMRIRKY